MGNSTTTCLTSNDNFITWEDSYGLTTGTGVSLKEACSPIESLAPPKSIMKIGTWDVPKWMYRIGKTAVVAREKRKYDIDVLGISECRWAGFGRMRVQTGETLLYSGWDNDAHLSDVAMLFSRKAASCSISWSAPVNDWIITAQFNSRYTRTSIVQVYASTNNAEEEEKDVVSSMSRCKTSLTKSQNMI